jgi:hypothetical protein
LADDAGLEGAELVGCPEEHRLHGHHPASGRARGHQGNQRRPDVHADGVGRAEQQQADERDGEAPREAEDDGEGAEEGDHQEEVAADVAAHRPDAQTHGDDGGPDAGGGSKPAEPDRVHAESVLGE